ncbi:hypothetical protein C4552_01855 [Candidatus Parcubacteria bacterium]|nr:MAG: hypothetical protein C4552_01855 [Candidatus Parcubacteria bacterium]
MKTKTLSPIVLVVVLGLALQGCAALGAGSGYAVGGPKGAIVGGLIGAGLDALAITSAFRSAKERERAEAAARAEAEALAKGITPCHTGTRKRWAQGALVVNDRFENCDSFTNRVHYLGDETYVSPPPGVVYKPGAVEMDPYSQEGLRPPAIPKVPVPVPPPAVNSAPPGDEGPDDERPKRKQKYQPRLFRYSR